jgi:hypothetical protein
LFVTAGVATDWLIAAARFATNISRRSSDSTEKLLEKRFLRERLLRADWRRSENMTKTLL